MFRSLPCLLALASALAAQVQTTAHVQESTIGNNGNTAPLGCNPTGLFAESRSQILIPAEFLPGPGAVLLGLGALGASSAGTNTSLTYASLRITISGTSATSLGASFAGNLPAPQTLMDVQNLTVQWQANAFTPITFVNTYTHDGTSSLVVDIQKIVSPIGDATMKTIQNARRVDLPRMVNAFGTAGSGAHAATTATATANSPISLQLRWGGVGGTHVPTVKLKSDPTAPFRAQFGIGQPIQVTVQGEPGSLFVDFESVARAVPLAIPGIAGQLWLADPVTLDAGIMPASGQSTVTQAVPADPALVGFYLAFQSLVISPAWQWQLTNMTDCFLTNGL
jgi:hypothetical protein